MTPQGWRAWYAGGVVYDSLETSWFYLPSRGLQIVKIYYVEHTSAGRPYTKQWDGCDWYWMDADGQIHGVPSGPRWGVDQPKPDAPDELVKKGTAVSDEHFDHLTMLARAAVELD